tara:strand:- start:1093 stop:1266 length:174 start_codon:yes stop_codon:yes gene_type:complete
MNIATSSSFRRNMKEHLDKVTEFNKPLVVTTNKPGTGLQAVVVLSKASYDLLIGVNL